MNPVDDKDVAAQISKLYELHQSGALSKSEFENAKRRVLGGELPRMAAQNPPVAEYREEPNQRFGVFRAVRALVIGAASFVALFVVLVLAVAFFTDGDSNTTRSTSSRQSAAPTATTQPVQNDPGPLMTGIVVMMGVANTETPGEACYGVGDHAMLAEGGSVSVTAIGGHQDKTARLSSGTVDQYGHCRMAFGIEWFDVDEYQFGFDDDLFVHCDRDTIVDIETNYTTQVRIAPNGAYCQPPAS